MIFDSPDTNVYISKEIYSNLKVFFEFELNIIYSLYQSIRSQNERI